MGEIILRCRAGRRIPLFRRLPAGEERQGDSHSASLQDHVSLQTGVTGIRKINISPHPSDAFHRGFDEQICQVNGFPGRRS
jgi:hypothetical protein